MHAIDISIVIGYLTLTLFIGLYYGWRNKDFKDYATGGKNFSIPMIVTTIFATFVGSINLMGWTNKVYSIGLVFAFAFLGESIYQLIVAKYIVNRMGRFTNCLTVGDMLQDQLGALGRGASGILSLIFCTGSLATQMIGLSTLLSYMFGIDSVLGLAIISFITILYSALGGIRAVVITDFVQFLIIIVAIPVVAAIATQTVGGGKEVIQKAFIIKQDFNSKDILFIGAFFFIASLPIFNPIFVQRLFLTRDLKNLSNALKISAAFSIFIIFILVFMSGAAYLLNDNIAPNNIFPFLVDKVLPTGLKGLAIAGAFAVIMSSIDSAVNTASVSFTRDILTVFAPKFLERDHHSRYIAQIVSVVVGVGSFLIAGYYKDIIAIFFFRTELWFTMMIAPIYAVIFNYKGTKKDFILAGILGSVALYTVKFNTTVPGLPSIVGLLVSSLVYFRKGLASTLIKKLKALTKKKRL